MDQEAMLVSQTNSWLTMQHLHKGLLINFFHNNGYLVIDHLFSVGECDAINKFTRKHANSSFSAILNPDRKFEEIRSVMKSLKIVSILKTLTNAEVVGLMSQLLFKETASPYASQAWNPHQDNTYPQTPNGEYITINIALQDQDVENGCLYIYPGSHKEGIAKQSWNKNKDRAKQILVDTKVVQKYKAKAAVKSTPKEKVEVKKEEAPVAEAPKEEAPKEEAPKEETPVVEAPKEEAPKEEAPKEEAPADKTDDSASTDKTQKDSEESSEKK